MTLDPESLSKRSCMGCLALPNIGNLRFRVERGVISAFIRCDCGRSSLEFIPDADCFNVLTFYNGAVGRWNITNTVTRRRATNNDQNSGAQ